MWGPEFRSLEPTQMPGGYGHPRPFQQGVSLSKLAKQTNLAILSGSRRPYYNEHFRKQLMKTPSVKLHLTHTHTRIHIAHTHIYTAHTHTHEKQKNVHYIYITYMLYIGSFKVGRTEFAPASQGQEVPLCWQTTCAVPLSDMHLCNHSVHT